MNYHLQWDEHISIALIIAYIELKSAFKSLRVSIERESNKAKSSILT